MRNGDLLVLATLMYTIWNLQVNMRIEEDNRQIMESGNRREELLKGIYESLQQHN
jgi:hypothetical protein